MTRNIQAYDLDQKQVSGLFKYILTNYPSAARPYFILTDYQGQKGISFHENPTGAGDKIHHHSLCFSAVGVTLEPLPPGHPRSFPSLEILVEHYEKSYTEITKDQVEYLPPELYASESRVSRKLTSVASLKSLNSLGVVAPELKSEEINHRDDVFFTHHKDELSRENLVFYQRPIKAAEGIEGILDLYASKSAKGSKKCFLLNRSQFKETTDYSTIFLNWREEADESKQISAWIERKGKELIIISSQPSSFSQKPPYFTLKQIISDLEAQGFFMVTPYINHELEKHATLMGVYAEIAVSLIVHLGRNFEASASKVESGDSKAPTPKVVVGPKDSKRAAPSPARFDVYQTSPAKNTLFHPTETQPAEDARHVTAKLDP